MSRKTLALIAGSGLALGALTRAAAGGDGDLPPDVPAKVDGVETVTIINNEPPGVRCNANIQAAAELANRYRVPINMLPASAAGEHVSAPAVFIGDDLLTQDGDAGNGTLTAPEIRDELAIRGAPEQPTPGLLDELDDIHADLRRAIQEGGG